MYCKHCRQAIPVGADPCPRCGAAQNDGARPGTYQGPGPIPRGGGGYDPGPPPRTAPPPRPEGGEEAVSTGRWMLTMLIGKIPLVGLGMLFVWAFGGGADARRNWARAKLLWIAVITVLAVVSWFGMALLAGLIGPAIWSLPTY